ncbi:MAG TPA: putative ABC exporter domain-containing protein [Opitutaceae bacterium]|nr:putative ABC exporter domain-containing protein [Opitutaceae bacterium]
MIGALLYLRLTSLKNRLLMRIKRLKQPKYLFGGIAGAVYFWFFFFRHLFGNSGRGANRRTMAEAMPLFPPELTDAPSLAMSLGALLLLGIVVVVWLAPKEKPALGFTETEIAFLFPAPLSRRMLINFKLLSSQFTILLTALFFTLISNRVNVLGGNALTHAVGWWLILSTLSLHFAGTNLTVTRLIDGGVSTWRRRLWLFGGLTLAVAGTLAWVWRDLQAPTPQELSGVDPFTRYLLTVLNGGALGWLLWPFRLVLGPFLAGDARTFFLALGPALLVVGAHYYWVQRMEVSFEDASVVAAEKRTAVLAQIREGKFQPGAPKAKARPGPFALAPTGPAEFAFLWKNLLSTRSYFSWRVLLSCAALIVIGSQWLHRALHDSPFAETATLVVPIFSLMAAAYVLLLGPHLARQDLRSDLGNADVLKTYPLRGWRLMLGELLTPTAILSGMFWLTVLAATLFFTPKGNMAKTFTPALQATCAICVCLAAPAVIALQLLALNGSTLLFPAWFQSTRGQAGGIEVMGQRMIFVFANLIVVLLALVPAGLVAGLLIFIMQWIIGAPAAVVLATLVVIAVLVGEIWCALWLLGERFEKFDLSAELRP